jgi:hypothetical protein
MQPVIGTSISMPHSKNDLAAADRVLRTRDHSSIAHTKALHQGTESSVFCQVQTEKYSAILGLLPGPATSETPCSFSALINQAGFIESVLDLSKFL